MPLIRTSRSYNKLPDTDASKFTGGTIKGFTGNTDLPDPPVTPAALTVLKQTLDDALIAANKGGTLATAIKDAARAAINTALDKNASYVDINCEDDQTILLSSGYDAVSTNRAQVVLDRPQVLGVDYAQAGKLKLRVKGDGNRKALQGRIKTLGGEWGPTISFKNSKAILFEGLLAGTTYVMQLIGLGGSTGQSDWSEPVSKMAL
jgi:hypothetical protein